MKQLPPTELSSSFWPLTSTLALLVRVWILVSIQIFPVASEFVGAVVLPHGDFAFDPTLLPPRTRERTIADQIAQASRHAGRWLSENIRPDLIFLSTPHGIKLDNDFGLFMGKYGSGSVEIGGDSYDNNKEHLYNISMRVKLAPETSKDLLSMLQQSNLNVSGIYSYNDDTDLPLQWGEIIPLKMIPNDTAAETMKFHSRRQHMIWSIPERRYDHAPDMVPELLRTGNDIMNWIQSQPERIAVVISSDLSHTHQAEGPYGYSNASAPFDIAIGQWANGKNLCSCQQSHYLLDIATGLQTDAMACGFTGLVLLHGMLCSGSKGGRVQGHVLANANVTYYGMMAATFELKSPGHSSLRAQNSILS